MCELLGLDPLYLANEGKLICIVDPDQAPAALNAMRADAHGQGAAIIGPLRRREGRARVWINTSVGGRRILDMLSRRALAPHLLMAA